MEEILMCWLKLSSSQPMERMRVLLGNHLIVIGDCYLENGEWFYTETGQRVCNIPGSLVTTPTHYMLLPPVPPQVNA
jgi:hypothetical protein